jgi:hypothetical protein
MLSTNFCRGWWHCFKGPRSCSIADSPTHRYGESILHYEYLNSQNRNCSKASVRYLCWPEVCELCLPLLFIFQFLRYNLQRIIRRQRPICLYSKFVTVLTNNLVLYYHYYSAIVAYIVITFKYVYFNFQHFHSLRQIASSWWTQW